ncbi:hypothetical protein BB561_006719 [Smittium simulii]|uniref:HMG box domain-containing protein n=1 Tax=Smittium simulii TaxID=133385 RepID=A0A2T9Y236_9FUNG|nr:hypothetical protein BB561_006719 [Smittium simulii]
MLKKLRLDKSHSTLSLATRDCIPSHHKPIASAAVLWQNCVSLANFSSKNNLFAILCIRHYSSNRRDIKLPGVDKLEQNVPTNQSIKSCKPRKYTREVSLKQEFNDSNSKKLAKSKSLELQKLKSKLAQNKLTSNHNKNTLGKLKFHKKVTTITPLSVPHFLRSSYNVYIQDEFAKIKKVLVNPTQLLKGHKNFKDVSERWSFMNEAEKLKYEQKFILLKEQYTTELYKWWDNIDKNLIKLENRRRRVMNKINKNTNIHKYTMLVDPRAPKRPVVANLMFHIDLEKLNPPDAPIERIVFTKYAAAKWLQLSESEKDIYRVKYNTALQLYKEASNKYKCK